MNEPSNPVPPNLPPTNPPSSPAQPPVSPPPAPMSAPRAKKSAMPWVLGGCGCLTLLFIIAAIVCYGLYRSGKNAVEKASKEIKEMKELQANTETPSTRQTPSTRRTPSTRQAPSAPVTGLNTYVNVKEKLPAKLQPNFVPFSFDYPDDFEVQPQGDVNFVKVEKYATQGKGYTAENFAVGYAWFTPPDADSDLLYDQLLDQLGQQFAGGFHNYKEHKRMPETVAGVRGKAAIFQADFNDAARTKIYGKTILLHPPGKKNGVTIIMLATSLDPDIRSANDVGVKGESAEILRSFRLE
jgi:hypothetical protein